MKILLLEDDTILQESIEEFLKTQNYNVDSFVNSNDAFDAIFSKEYDLLLLDVNVPGDWNGFALRQELNNEKKTIPTIFVTSLTSSDALIQGYASGCCDYIKKPFDMVELLLRIQQALKSSCFKSADTHLELGQGYSYNLNTYELTCHEQSINLSKREIELLNLFIQHRNQILSFEMLYEKIWDNSVDPANARVQINNLRRKLPKDIITNTYGLGYKLDCK